MYLLLMLSLALMVNAICRELDRRAGTSPPMKGRCPSCQAETESGWLACAQCSTLLRTACNRCGEHHDSWDHFCPWCGAAEEVFHG